MQQRSGAEHRMTGEPQLLILGEHSKSRGPTGQVDAAQEHGLELAHLTGQLLLDHRRQPVGSRHHHQPVALAGVASEHVDVPVGQGQHEPTLATGPRVRPRAGTTQRKIPNQEITMGSSPKITHGL